MVHGTIPPSEHVDRGHDPVLYFGTHTCDHLLHRTFHRGATYGQTAHSTAPGIGVKTPRSSEVCFWKIVIGPAARSPLNLHLRPQKLPLTLCKTAQSPISVRLFTDRNANYIPPAKRSSVFHPFTKPSAPSHLPKSPLGNRLSYGLLWAQPLNTATITLTI